MSNELSDETKLELLAILAMEGKYYSNQIAELISKRSRVLHLMKELSGIGPITETPESEEVPTPQPVEVVEPEPASTPIVIPTMPEVSDPGPEYYIPEIKPARTAGGQIVDEMMAKAAKENTAYSIDEIAESVGINRWLVNGKVNPDYQQIASRIINLRQKRAVVKVGSRNGAGIYRLARPGERDKVAMQFKTRQHFGRRSNEEIVDYRNRLLKFIKDENMGKFNTRVLLNRIELAKRGDLRLSSPGTSEASRLGAMLDRLSKTGYLERTNKGVYRLPL